MRIFELHIVETYEGYSESNLRWAVNESSNKKHVLCKKNIYILSRILVMRQEVNGFRIRWIDLFDKLITITITQK
jgi:hypothetical protein